MGVTMKTLAVLFAVWTVALCAPVQQRAPPQFNFTKCPALHEVQQPHFKESGYDLHKTYPGVYYELAFHDILQAMCPSVSCVNSNKTVRTYPNGQVYVHEDWGLECMDHSYPQVLLNNITKDDGFFLAFVPTSKLPFVPKGLLAGVTFPNMVVDFKQGESDGWTLEFQCWEYKGHVRYIGVNFYAKQDTDEAYEAMMNASKVSGIDFFFNGGKTGFNFRRVSHKNCPSEPNTTVV